MCQRVDEPAPSQRRQLAEVPPPRTVRAELSDEARLHVEGKPSQEVDRAEEVVPGIWRQELGKPIAAIGHPIDLEAELHRQPLALSLQDSVAVVVQVVPASFHLK